MNLRYYSVLSPEGDMGVHIFKLSELTFGLLSGNPLSSLNFYAPDLEETERIQKKTRHERAENPFYKIAEGKLFLTGEVRFNLCYLKNIDLQNLDYLLVSDLDDLLQLVFLFKMRKLNPKKVSVLCSEALSYLAPVYLREFRSRILARNSKIDHRLLGESYFEESEFLDYFENALGTDFSEWTQIFTLEDLDKFLAVLSPKNFGQPVQVQ